MSETLSKALTLRMAEDEWARIDHIAQEEGRSRSDVLRRLVGEALEARTADAQQRRV
jgi:predicted transcriptional regulator